MKRKYFKRYFGLVTVSIAYTGEGYAARVSVHSSVGGDAIAKIEAIIPQKPFDMPDSVSAIDAMAEAAFQFATSPGQPHAHAFVIGSMGHGMSRRS